MGWLQRFIARLFRTQPTGQAQALVSHVHRWDICRDYGQYKYRICLNGCDQRKSC